MSETQQKTTAGAVRYDFSLLTETDLYLFNEGTHSRLYLKLGSHVVASDDLRGTFFAVWAPNAEQVFVMGNFNSWDLGSHPLRARGESGIWEGFVPGLGKGEVYKYYVVSRYNGHRAGKADPYAIFTEVSPRTGSITWDLDYVWGDREWMEDRSGRNALGSPISIYEVHLGSWRRVPEEDNRPLTYRELAGWLPEYAAEMGFTHVEMLPVMEHPFYGSWGYQTTGYFAPSSRYGSPQDFMYLIDRLHQRDIGVILDWVPSHFPTDDWALGFFDGTHLYEHADARKGIHPDWNSYIFNYGRKEVPEFLISSALFWLDRYHADGLRIDAVASMLYLDYSRKNGEWLANDKGGRENLEAVAFLRRFNEEVYRSYPGVQTIAEESTAWPMVSRPTYAGGLGFGLKWDMGWMHDTLDYMGRDPLFRRYYHDKLTFRQLYSFSENFVLPLSHDEVVHEKGSLLARMPGGEADQFANLRALFGYMYAQQGKKLVFMGGEFGQRKEWNHDSSLEWHLVQSAAHAGLQRWVRDLNRFYASRPALHELDCDSEGFRWIDCDDCQNSVISFMRTGRSSPAVIVAVLNFTPVLRSGYMVGAPLAGGWRECLNSDATAYGGTGLFGNKGMALAVPVPCQGHPYSLKIDLPPLSCLFFESEVSS